MSKLADYNTPEARVTVFAEELKEIAKTSKLTPEIIDIVADSYIDMVYCYGLMVFARDEEKIEEIVEELQEPGADGIATKKLMDKFDEEGIDYIFDNIELL